MKVLLADSDTDLVDLISYVLLRQGHRVTVAADGSQAQQRLLAEQPDLAVLDVGIQPINGYELCRQIRLGSQMPVILLSTRADEGDIVRGYESGADDFIIKPFSPKQLLLRIDALMRRVNCSGNSGYQSSRVTIGDLTVDPVAYDVRKNGVRLPLTRLEFRILYCLAQSAGALVEARRLAEFAWQSPAGGDASLLKTHVSHIRQKLTDAGGEPLQIRAVPRAGYILSLPDGGGTQATEHVSVGA